ncbi:uncharacterized protein [Malus domestica]|uniref:uncharacterized protein n=1 Tax=Malus domestica TaxID=3750 RepID=UPI0039748A59
MENGKLARFTYGGLCVVSSISSFSTFNQICIDLCSRFKCLRVGCFELRYGLNENPNCVLDCDVDVLNMLMVLDVVGKSIVEILVIDKCDGSIVQLPSESTSSSCRTLDSMIVSSENDHLGKYGSYGVHNYMSCEWDNYIESEGQVFRGGCVDFRDKLKKFSVECGFDLKYLKNDKNRISAECSRKESDGCLWRVYASKCDINNFFIIRKLHNLHTCKGMIQKKKNKVVGRQFVASLIKDKVQSNPLIKPKEIISNLKQFYGLDIDYSTAYFGKQMAVFELNGVDVDADKFLPWYVESARSSNPGSVFELEVVSESNRFLRLFIAYDAWIKGFMFCYSMLFIDSTFIKSKYKGTLLSYCAKNGNDEIFELAYAIVDSETIANWRWFLAILSGILRPQGRNVSTLFPKAAGERLKKKMMNLLANCAYACTPSDFDDCIAEFKDNGQGHVKNFLCDLPKENYVIAHFPGKRWGSMSNALSESFNAMVSNSRCMPLMDLLEDIRVRLMGSMAEKRIFGQNIHTILCPKKENEMKLMLKEGMHWRISHSDADVFEVLQHDNRDVFYYVDDYWKASFYRKTYQFVMHPFSDLEKPNVDTIINGVRPPITKIPSGRPKKTRIKSTGEISGSKKTVTCNRCGCSGHNKVSCKVVIQEG